MQKKHVKKLQFRKKSVIFLNTQITNKIGGNTNPVLTGMTSARYSCGDPRCNGTYTKPDEGTINPL